MKNSGLTQVVSSRENNLAEKASFLQEQGKLAEAIVYYQQLLQLRPHWPQVYYNLGIIWQKQHDFPQAVSCYQQAIAQQPNYFEAYFNLAVLYQQQGLIETAIEIYQKTIQIAPKQIGAYSNLGCLWIELGEYSKAIELFKKAIDLAPEQADLYNNLGRALFLNGELDQATTNYLKAIQKQPNLVEAYENLGVFFYNQKLYSVAIQYFQQALQLKPDSVSLQSSCAATFLSQNQYSEALSCLQQIVGLKPSWVEAYCQWAEQLNSDDIMNRATIACSQLLNRLQHSNAQAEAEQYLAETYLYLGKTLAEYRNYSAAEIYYKKAISIQPQYTEAFLAWGDCLAKQWRFNAAALQYHKALGQQPDNLEFYQKVHEVLEKQQQAEQGHLKFTLVKDRDQLKLPPSFKAPDSNSHICHGLDCQPCLKQLRQRFQPQSLGSGIEQYFPPSALPWKFPEPTVTILPQGRAWIAPKTSWWNVCNAIAIFNEHGELISELSRFYPTPLPGCKNYDWSQHQIFSLEELPPVKVIEGRVAVLSGLSGNVYFHWMVDILPRIDILRQNQIDLDSIDWFLINSTQQRFQRETLEKLGIPPHKILESDQVSYVQASSLIVPSFPAPVGWVVPTVIDFLRKLFLTEFSPGEARDQGLSISNIQNPEQALNTSYPKRIYISRNRARYRRVLNEPELIEYLSQWGFTCVELETLSVQNQADLFAQAEIIIAAHGAGLTNLIFCQPHTVVVELVSPHYVRHYYWLITQQLGIKHYSIQGEGLDCSVLRELMYPTPLVEDLWINLNSLEKMLKLLDILNNKDSPSNSFCKPRAMILSSEQTEVRIEDWLRQAKDYFAQKDFELAIQACQNALKINLNCAEAYTILGNVLQNQGNFEQAQENYEKAIQLQPNLPEPSGNLGSLYAKQKKWELAVKYYQIALQHKPDSETLYRNLGKVLTQLNRISEATEAWYHAYQLQPELVSAEEQLNLGKTLLEQGKGEKAIACFRNALKQDPNCKEAETALEKAQNQKPNFQEEALKVIEGEKKGFERLRAVNEEEILQQAEQDLNNNLLKEAISQCQQVIGSSPNQPKAYEILGKALHQLGRLDLASRAYRKLVKLKPKDAIAYTNLGNLYAKQGQWKLAVSAYKRAIALNPNLAVAYRNLAQVFERVGQPDLAIQYWYQGFSLKPEAVKATEHLALGSLLLRRGRLLDATTCYQQAIRFDPACAEAYHNLGEVLASQGQWDEAIAYYQQALKINPNAFETYNSLGKALGVQGRWQEVLTCYHQALELNPRLLMALQNLTQALIHSSDSLQESGNSSPIWQMLAGAFLSRSARRELQSPEVWETWTTTAVSVSESLEESSPYQQAQARFEQGDYQGCIRDCEQLLVSCAQKVAIYWLLGEAWLALGNGEKAKHYYQQGIKQQPQQAEGYLRIGEVYAQEGNWKYAIACYQKAIQFQPSALTYRRLSQGWQALGNQENAEDCLYEALRLEPEQVSVQDSLQLGDALWERGQKTQAMICYGQALVRDPHRAICHPQLGERLQQPKPEDHKVLQMPLSNPTLAVYNGNDNGKYSSVKKHQKQLLEQAYQNFKLTQWQACIEICRQVIKQEPQNLEAYRLMAQAFQSQGEILVAQQIYEQLRQLQPEDGELYGMLGDIYAEQEQWQDALESYQRALQLNPELTSVQEALGDIWSRQGQWQKAMTCYQQVLEAEPGLWEVHHKLGDVFWQQGEVDAAAEAYQQAAQLSQVS